MWHAASVVNGVRARRHAFVVCAKDKNSAEASPWYLVCPDGPGQTFQGKDRVEHTQQAGLTGSLTALERRNANRRKAADSAETDSTTVRRDRGIIIDY